MNEPAKTLPATVAELEMVKLTLDGKTVNVPKEAVDILEAKDQELKAGFNRKLEEEHTANANTLAEEKAKVQSDLEYDLNWYSTHPDEADWGGYKPKTMGGDGSFDKPQGVQSVELVQKPAQNPFETNPDYDKLTKELAEVKTTMSENKEQREAKDFQDVITARDEILSRCKNVNEKVASSLLNTFRATNNRHPTKPEIISIIKEEDNRVATIAEKQAEAMFNAKINPTSAMPQAGGQSPVPEGTELPQNFDDIEKLVKIAHDINTTVG